MNTFFSGEDIDELHTNVENYSKNGSYYLSLIVNMAEKYTAKIVKLIEVPSTEIVIEEEGEEVKRISSGSEQMMMMFDLDIEIESILEDDDLMERIGELKKANEVKAQQAKKQTPQVNGNKLNQPKRTVAEQAFIDWDSFGEEAAYTVSQKNISLALNQILARDLTTEKETGQLLRELNDLNGKEYNDILGEIEDNAYLMLIDAFGFDNLKPATEGTIEELQKFRKIEVFKDVVDDLIPVFKDVLFIINQ